MQQGADHKFLGIVVISHTGQGEIREIAGLGGLVEEKEKSVIIENMFKHINKLKDSNQILIISNLVKTFKIKE